MIVRTLLSVLAAVGMAATLLGAVDATHAQAPPTPQAAPGAKPPKPPKPPAIWPPDADTLKKRRLEAEALPLFASVEPFDVTITADFKAVQRDRNVDSKKTYPGTLSIMTGGVAGPAIPIQLRTRGHVRRNTRTCGFAPLRLELQKDQLKGTIFEGQGTVKLGTHCQDGDVFQQYMLKEHLASRILNVLTPRSLRSRLANVTYADSAAGKKPYTKFGIFYEDADDMAKRMDARELPVPRQMFSGLDQASLLFMSLFQYMIGNTDYSILMLHNVIMLDDVKGVRYAVPYDFDYSGLVYTHYAVAAKALELSSVRERLYRGPCKTEAELESALEPFRARKDDILALPAAMPGLDEGPRKNTEKYLNEFFELISRPDKVKRTFVTDCKPIGGM
jgi:hypothetical protein